MIHVREQVRRSEVDERCPSLGFYVKDIKTLVLIPHLNSHTHTRYTFVCALLLENVTE
jgi:hypothetical protein